jgi:hypothetical protein
MANNNEEKKSVLDITFKEIDEKFSILNKENIDWIKSKIMDHITEAYERGSKVKK